jgi:hypothetical protein
VLIALAAVFVPESNPNQGLQGIFRPSQLPGGAGEFIPTSTSSFQVIMGSKGTIIIQSSSSQKISGTVAAVIPGITIRYFVKPDPISTPLPGVFIPDLLPDGQSPVVGGSPPQYVGTFQPDPPTGTVVGGGTFIMNPTTTAGSFPTNPTSGTVILNNIGYAPIKTTITPDPSKPSGSFQVLPDKTQSGGTNSTSTTTTRLTQVVIFRKTGYPSFEIPGKYVIPFGVDPKSGKGFFVPDQEALKGLGPGNIPKGNVSGLLISENPNSSPIPTVVRFNSEEGTDGSNSTTEEEYEEYEIEIEEEETTYGEGNKM